MPIAEFDNLEIAYLDEGEGKTILLLHGFASSKSANWVEPGWVSLLVDAGFRVIAPDNRGHGGSSKFHDAADYSLALMAEDAKALIDRLGITRPHVMGYSMGARIAARMAIDTRSVIDKLVLAGNGDSMIKGTGDWSAVRQALLAPSLADVTDPRGRAFRKFADQTKSDLTALAECVTAVRETFSKADFARIENPALVVIGEEDDIAGDGKELAALMPAGRFVPVPGRDHMRTVGDKVYKQAVLDFLAEQ